MDWDTISKNTMISNRPKPKYTFQELYAQEISPTSSLGNPMPNTQIPETASSGQCYNYSYNSNEYENYDYLQNYYNPDFEQSALAGQDYTDPFSQNQDSINDLSTENDPSELQENFIQAQQGNELT